MIWLTFAGSGLALRNGAQIGHRHAAGRTAATGRAPCGAAGAGMLLAVRRPGLVRIDYALRTRLQVSAALGVSMMYVYIGMPVGCALLAAHLLLIARRYVGRAASSQPTTASRTTPPRRSYSRGRRWTMTIICSSPPGGVPHARRPVGFSLTGATLLAVALGSDYRWCGVKEMFVGIDSSRCSPCRSSSSAAELNDRRLADRGTASLRQPVRRASARRPGPRHRAEHHACSRESAVGAADARRR